MQNAQNCYQISTILYIIQAKERRMMKENFTSLHRVCLMTDWMTMRKSRGIFGRRMPVMIVLRCTGT